jgi:hypothetical protein
MFRRCSIEVIAALSLVGCTGVIGDAASSDSGSPDVPLPPNPTVQQCEGVGTRVGAAPLRRLTRLEYARTIRDLLEVDVEDVAGGLSPDDYVDGFASNAGAPVDEDRLYEYLGAAQDVASRAVSSGGSRLPTCDLADDACVRSFVDDLATRAFRRPVDAEARDAYVSLFAERRSEAGVDAALELTIAAILFSPRFLYHVEPVAETGPALLDDYSLSSRLSYFLWASMPDEQLFAAAEAGELSDPAEFEAHARRLLSDPRAERAIGDFHHQWLGVESLEEVAIDAITYPEWDASLARGLMQETDRFATETILRGDGRLSSLLTASHTFAGAELAATYGLPAPDASGRIDLEGHPRAGLGLLGHPSLLATYSGASIIIRGRMIRERFLCDPIPDPPDDIDLTSVEGDARLTTPPCNACHQRMDPIGRAFERFDTIGRHHDRRDDGTPIDVAGEIAPTERSSEIAGPFETPAELAQRLAGSDAVGDCVTRQWLRYARRQAVIADEECELVAIRDRFRESGYDVRELLVAIATSDAFRMRDAGRIEEVEP